MLANLSGIIKTVNPPELILQVGDIGYEIFCPLPVFYHLQKGANVTLYTHLSIKEDAHTLFGFLAQKDKTMFRELIKVSGVGPKVALAILSHLSSDELKKCIENEDDTLLAKTPGIGKKTAQKLIIELKSKVEKFSFGEKHTPNNTSSQAVEALLSLGFKDKEIKTMMQNIDATLPTADIIKLALQNK